MKLWSWWTDSNPRPADYKSAALPAELHQQFQQQNLFYQTSMVLSTGNFTFFCIFSFCRQGLEGRCSSADSTGENSCTERVKPAGGRRCAALSAGGDREWRGVLVLQRRQHLRRLPAGIRPAGAGALPPDPGKGGDGMTLAGDVLDSIQRARRPSGSGSRSCAEPPESRTVRRRAGGPAAADRGADAAAAGDPGAGGADRPLLRQELSQT